MSSARRVSAIDVAWAVICALVAVALCAMSAQSGWNVTSTYGGGSGVYQVLVLGALVVPTNDSDSRGRPDGRCVVVVGVPGEAAAAMSALDGAARGLGWVVLSAHTWRSPAGVVVSAGATPPAEPGGETILEPGKVDKIKTFKTGFARLALDARVPVIPCCVIGLSERRMPTIPGPLVDKVIKHPKAGQGYSSVMYKRAACRIGVPLDFGDLYDKPVNKQLLDLITNKVRQIIMKLYNGEDLDRFLTGETPFDFAYERVGSGVKKLL